MRAFVICGPDTSLVRKSVSGFSHVTIEGVDVTCAVVETPDPPFDPKGAHRAHVLIRVRAFSLNYRDKSLILRAARTERRRAINPVGSDFVAVVEATGADVTDLAPGDRVIGDYAYPDSGTDGLLPGVASNHGSRERHVLHRRKLLKIPDAMSDETAAGFTIGGQTAFSMARKLALKPGDRALLTACKSHTSIFALSALAADGVEVHGVSRNDRFAEELRGLGLHRLIVFDPTTARLSDHPAVGAVMAKGGYHGVVDPFSDVFLPHMPTVMAMDGRYVTCGFWDQYSDVAAVERPISAVRPSPANLVDLITKNLSIIGNCIGTTDDLKRALTAHVAGRLPVPIDRVLSEGDEGELLRRTYVAPDRWGKVVYRYA